MDLSRVVELYDRKYGTFGSGYALSGMRVLTAYHVVHTQGDLRVRPISSLERCHADVAGRVIWESKDLDLALIEPVFEREQYRWPDWPLAPLGRIEDLTIRTVQGVGFPQASATGAKHDTYHLHGTLLPGSGFKSGRKQVSVVSPRPQEADDWKGLSGTAIHCNGIVIGVAVDVDLMFADATAIGVRLVGDIADDAEFWASLGAPKETALQTLGLVDHARSFEAYSKWALEIVDRELPSDKFVWPRAERLGMFGNVIGSPADLRSLVETIVASPTYSLTVLLGSYGTGKTTFIYAMGRHLWQQRTRDPSQQIYSLYFPLNAADLTKSPLENLASYIADTALVPHPRKMIEAILASDRRCVLFLDGFDELANRLNFASLPRMLSWLKRLPVSDHLRIVMSARTTFFGSELDIGRLHAHHTLRILPFDRSQIEEYLDRNAAQSKRQIVEMLDGDKILEEVCQTPIHLAMVGSLVTLDDTDIHEQAATSIISSTGLYRTFLQKTVQDHVGASTILGDAESQLGLLKAIAVHWFHDRIFEWAKSDVADFLRQSTRSAVTEDMVQEIVALLKAWNVFVAIGSKYRFRHRSFQEVLVAMSIAESSNDLEERSWSAPFYAEIWDHIYNLLPAEYWNLERIVAFAASANPVAIANLMCVGYRNARPEVLPILLRQCQVGMPPTVRSVAVQGLGYFEPTSQVLNAVRELWERERNTVIRWQLHLTARYWRRSWAGSFGEGEPAEMFVEPAPPASADASEIGYPEQYRNILPDPDMVTESFRRSLRQTDAFWNAYSTPILVLAPLCDASSIDAIRALGNRTSNPEIGAAYGAVLDFLSSATEATGG